MKIIVSSRLLSSKLHYIVTDARPITKWKLVHMGLMFFDSASETWIDCGCEASVSIRSEIKEEDFNVEFPFDTIQWSKIYRALKYFPEQPIVMELGDSAEGILNGDSKISISQCVLVF